MNCGDTQDDATESGATAGKGVEWGYTQLVVATINHLHAPVTTFKFGCSDAQIYNPEVRDEGSGDP